VSTHLLSGPSHYSRIGYKEDRSHRTMVDFEGGPCVSDHSLLDLSNIGNCQVTSIVNCEEVELPRIQDGKDSTEHFNVKVNVVMENISTIDGVARTTVDEQTY
jgi:hypothetical protein